MSTINATVRYGPAGWTYRNSTTEQQPFFFEQVDLFWWQTFMANYWKLSLYTGAIFLITIFGLQKWMKSRPPMNLRTALFWWNTGMGLFSIVGFVRTAPALVDTLGKSHGFYLSVCKKDHFDTPLGFWMLLFILSKFVQLGDTVFIVLRKRPLVFLHWYHHLTALNFCWILGPLIEPISIFGMVLNYGEHMLMYPYFALTGIGFKIPKGVAKFITSCQLGQMIIMFVINALTAYYYYAGEDCARSALSIKIFVFVFGSFVFLFGKLFIDSVIKSGSMKRNVAAVDKKYENVKNE